MLNITLRFLAWFWLSFILILFFSRGLMQLRPSPILAFLSDINDSPDILLSDVQTGLLVNITERRSADQNLLWSADGRYLVFQSSQMGINELWLFDSHDWQIRKLMRLGESFYYEWSSLNELSIDDNFGLDVEGFQILNVETGLTRPYIDGFGCCPVGGCFVLPSSVPISFSLMAINDVPGLQVVISESSLSTNGTELEPIWSPDRKSFLFVTELQGQPDLYWSLAEGGIARRLTNTPSPEQMPRWSSDGLKISYVSYEDGNPEVYIMELATGYRYNLSHQETRDYNPVWQPLK